MSAKKYYDLAKNTLLPINRSITGSGVRKTLKIIQKEFPELKVKQFKSGKKVFDWTIPLEWNVKDAYVLDKDKKLESKLLKHNLSDVDRVYDSMIYENNLYLAYVKKTRECKKIVISFANLNNEKLNFADFFISKCSKVAPGRMAVFSKNNEKGKKKTQKTSKK